MNKANTEIRRSAKKARVSLADIAAAVGCDEQRLARWLRDGLPANMKPKILEFIERRAAAREGVTS